MLLSAMQGCGKDDAVPAGQPDRKAVLRTEISARAANDTNALGAAESVIRRVRIYAFDGDNLDKMVYAEFAPGMADNAVVEMEVTQTASKMLYVVVNEPEDSSVTRLLENIENPAALKSVGYRMADYFNGMAGTVFDSSADFDTAGFCLPMSGATATPVNTKGEYLQSNPLIVPMSVTRSLARVDIYVQKEYALGKELIIDRNSSIDIANTSVAGWLWGSVAPSGGLSALTGINGSATPLVVENRPAPDAPDDFTAAQRAFTFYTPERSCTGESERIAFTLKGLSLDGERKDYPQVVVGSVAGKELTQIDRNRIYRIYCTFLRKTLNIELTFSDWNDVEIDGDIAGTTLAVSNNRIVMDYVPLGERFDTTVDYVSDGTVSFVGYVVDGKLTTDGSNLPTWLPKANITGLPDGTTMKGTIRMEYVPTLLQYGDTHPGVALRIKTGNITREIRVVYDNGFIPESFLPSEWTLNRPVKGIQVAKRGNILPDRVADINWDREVMQWAPDSSPPVVDAGAKGYGYGAANTTAIIAAVGTQSAAYSCRRNMGEKWYLSSRDELLVVYLLRWSLGPSYTFLYDVEYWSSTDALFPQPGALNAAWYVQDPDMTRNNPKRYFYRVRCVRNY